MLSLANDLELLKVDRVWDGAHHGKLLAFELHGREAFLGVKSL
jgi:hypothetical protein